MTLLFRKLWSTGQIDTRNKHRCVAKRKRRKKKTKKKKHTSSAKQYQAAVLKTRSQFPTEIEFKSHFSSQYFCTSTFYVLKIGSNRVETLSTFFAVYRENLLNESYHCEWQSVWIMWLESGISKFFFSLAFFSDFDCKLHSECGIFQSTFFEHQTTLLFRTQINEVLAKHFRSRRYLSKRNCFQLWLRLCSS